jgi:hypothetical protein
MKAKFAAARQKEIGADTQRLLQLVQEFRAEVGKSDNYADSPIGIKKITEIEKLAKTLKTKASSSEFVGGFRFRQSSQGVIEGYLHRFEGAKSERSSGNHTNFVVEALNRAA